jgi:LPXTG-motif cell wall-anchored protein
MTKTVASFTLCALMLCSLSAAAFAAGESSPEWHGAQWIWESKTNKPDQWVFLRKTFTLEAVPKTAMAKISIDSRYWLYVNGELAIREGQLKNGPAPGTVYYDEENLAPWLRPGENTIAVLGCYWGSRKDARSFSSIDSGRAGFVFDLDVGGTHIVSDATWKARKNPAHTRLSPAQPTYRLPESSVYYDARREIPGWHLPGFDDSAWCAAVALGAAPCKPWGGMVPRSIPQFKDYGLKEYLNMEEVRETISNEARELHMMVPHNAHVNPWLHVSDPVGGRKIRITTDATDPLGATYITKKGEQVFETPAWTNGEAVIYSIPAGVTVHRLQYRETGYDTTFDGYFTCDDPFLNRLWEMSARTLYVTMRDNYMDCPDRERAQWWGDVTNESVMAFYALNPSSYALYRKGVDVTVGWTDTETADENLRDVLLTVAPSMSGYAELPLQQLAGVHGFWEYYMYTGQRDLIEQVYLPTKNYLAKWSMNESGLIVHRGGSWDWDDWGTGNDTPLGYEEDVPWFEERMASIAGAYDEAFWNGEAYISDKVDEPDDRANAVAVIAGLASKDKYPALLENVFLTRMQASPYMEKYVGDAMFQMGYAAEGIERIKLRYAEMVDSGYSTLSETFPRNGTHNHAWSGGPLVAMSRDVAGVAPSTPGYGTYRILPRLGPLNSARARVPSVKGNIDVDIARGAGSLTMRVASPRGTVATVGVPRLSGGCRVTVDGSLLFGDGQPTGETVPGITYLKNDAEFVYFTVQPGSYTFSASGGRTSVKPPATGEGMALPIAAAIALAAAGFAALYLRKKKEEETL